MLWKKRPTAVLASLLVIHVLAHIDRNMLLGFSPQIIADLKISNTQYGFLVGVVWVLSFGFMALFLGSLADRFSRTRIIAAGVFIWSLCTWASGHAQSFEQMALARFFVASGEAALVPAAVSILTELFSEQRRSTIMGIFFMGIPMGIGASFLLAGTFGASHGWRSTFYALGWMGIVIAVLLAFLNEDRSQAVTHERGAPFVQQVRTVLGLMRSRPALLFLIIAFVLLHILFAGLSFTQLWMVKERGMDASSIAAHIGTFQLLFGATGSVVGGIVGDRLARRLPGGHPAVIVLFIAMCAVPMVAYRFVAPGSWAFYVGMCAGFFLPLACYGSANAAIMSMVPSQTRSTVAGFTMLCINVFAIALGNLAAGRAVDMLAAQGVSAPLTHVVLATDFIAIGSGAFFALAALFSVRRRESVIPVPARA
ncbi:MFS transporter [Bradyrhizobium erythrophlei]|uniref:MFS transporter n=1 Tax=Bradyrhizobium erythrophlei TaxID=1437360 RepID=UPI0035E6ACBD